MNFRFVLALPLLLGCSSSDSENTPAPSGSAPIAVKAPTTQLRLLVIDNEAERVVSGAFLEGSNSGTSCERSTVGGCRVSVCTKTDGAMKGTPVDAGKITVSSPSFGTDVEVPLVEGYPRLIQGMPFPATAEDIRFVGAGSSKVAPFDLTVKMPTPAKLVSAGSCAADATGCELAREAFTIAWTGAAGGHVAVNLSPSLDTDTKTSLTCYFNGDSGKGTVPAEAMAKLPAAAHGLSLTAGNGPVESQGGAGLAVAAEVQRWGKGLRVTLK